MALHAALLYQTVHVRAWLTVWAFPKFPQEVRQKPAMLSIPSCSSKLAWMVYVIIELGFSYGCVLIKETIPSKLSRVWQERPFGGVYVAGRFALVELKSSMM